ncbi:MAG: hypothetical protein RSB37_00615 [Acetivibrio sp.]
MMLIKTYNRDYYIIQRQKETEIQEILICEENSDINKVAENGQKYLIIHITDKETIYQVVPFFTKMQESTTFEDYVECFSKEGDFYAVFRYQKEKKLAEKLREENCSFRERLEIGKRLLEKMVLLNMPLYVQYEVLRNENMGVSETLESVFEYSLCEYEQYPKITSTMVNQRIKVIMEQLFAEEIKLNSSPILMMFYESFQEESEEYQDYKTYFSLYQNYDKMYQELLKEDSYLKIRPNTKAFRIWDKLKSKAKFMRAIGTVALLLCIMIFIVFSSFQKKEKKEGERIESIGTIKIMKDEKIKE